MRDFAELKISRGGKPIARPAPTEELFDAFEAETGLKVPENLRRLLRHSNGGHPELDSVDGGEGGFAVDKFLHLSVDDRGSQSMWEAWKTMRPYIGENGLPFACTGGGDVFFLDLSLDPPSVDICLHEEDMGIFEVSPSFEAFIDSLALNPDYL